MRHPINTSYFGAQGMRARAWFARREFSQCNHLVCQGGYHRICGPAIERDDGTKEWHLNGQFRGSEYGDSPSKIFMHHEFPGYGP